MERTWRIGLLGMGTVGAAVARRLLDDAELLQQRSGRRLQLAAVAVRDPARARDLDLGEVPLRTDAVAVASDPQVDVVVEVMGGTDIALQAIEAALQAGKPVVTANKAVMAQHGPRVLALAAKSEVALRFEAAAGAGLPVIALLRDSLRADRIHSLDAIINGTTNVILGRMADGVSYSAALAEAQQRGFAEADPSSDVDGWDAAYKLILLASLAFGAAAGVESVDREGIGDLDAEDLRIAAALGCSLKLLAHAEMDGERLGLSVRPTLLPRQHPLAGVDGADNALLVNADWAGPILMRGAGAGGESTASAVLNDCIAIAAGDEAGIRAAVSADAGAATDVERCAAIRLASGADVAVVAQMLEDRGVPVEGTVTASDDGEEVVLTGPASRGVLRRSLETVDSIPGVEVIRALERVPG